MENYEQMQNYSMADQTVKINHKTKNPAIK